MRGTHTFIDELRRQVFTEVARMAYEDADYSRIEELPYEIIPGEIAEYRDNIFLERAIVGERLRLAMGLPLREVAEHAPISKDIEKADVAERYYEPPLVNIIKFACNACPTKQVFVTDACQGCLAHPCEAICPVNAVDITPSGRSEIDREKCINCGKCVQQCPYNAIIEIERPCAAACGVDAIESDAHGRAEIDQEKCVSCGMCLVNCPFSAIADKSQIYQVIQSIKLGDDVVAAVAPAYIGQFGRNFSPGKMKLALEALDIEEMMEVAVGADLSTVEEAQHFIERVPGEQPFMATSCCPSWSVMAKKFFPELKPYVSMTLTPMVVAARMIKKENPNAKVVFIGPCAAKKLEASRSSVRSDVDFVLTFEELMGMFAARGVDLDKIAEPEGEHYMAPSTADGRGFPVVGGVASAVVDVIHQMEPEREVPVDCADGLRECRKMLTLARAGKRDGYLLEGMACPGGCIGGAGTIEPLRPASSAVEGYKREVMNTRASDSQFLGYLSEIYDDHGAQ